MSTHYSKYEKYKKTNIEWLPQVPAGWEIKRLKYVANIRASNVDKKSVENQPNIELCNYTDVYYNEHITVGMDFMKATASINQIKDFSLKSGDVLITKDSESPDDIAIAAFVPKTFKNVICGYHLAHITPKKIYGEYLFRAFQSTQYRQYFEIRANGITRYGVGKAAIDNAPFLLPSLSEQKAIATFLDKKTRRIHTLLEKLKRQKELLTEKRISLITHAVTHGLNLDAPMKETGEEWLPQVPAGWEIKRLKYLVSHIGSGKTPRGGAEVYIDSGVMLLRSQNIYDDGLRLDDVVYISKEVEAVQLSTRVCASDVLLNITGASIGRTNFIPENFPDANVNQHVCIFRPVKQRLFFSFLHILFCSLLAKKQILCGENGTSREGLNFEQAGNLLFAFPTLPEQKAIAKYLDKQTRRIDLLQSKIDKQIELLREYRTSLITSTVTGQIKVS